MKGLRTPEQLYQALKLAADYTIHRGGNAWKPLGLLFVADNPGAPVLVVPIYRQRVPVNLERVQRVVATYRHISHGVRPCCSNNC